MSRFDELRMLEFRLKMPDMSCYFVTNGVPYASAYILNFKVCLGEQTPLVAALTRAVTFLAPPTSNFLATALQV